MSVKVWIRAGGWGVTSRCIRVADRGNIVTPFTSISYIFICFIMSYHEVRFNVLCMCVKRIRDLGW